MECIVFIDERPMGAMVLTGAYAPVGNFPCHRAFFCPHTGQIWARFMMNTQEPTLWIIEYASREGQERRRQEEVPGSLILEDHDYVPGFFPDSLIEREFFVHLNYARRYLAWPRNSESPK